MEGYSTDLSDAQWALIEPRLPPLQRRGRRRTVNLRAVVNAIFYLLRTGCQWRLLPQDFPPWGTVWWYFRQWRRAGTWTRIHRALYPLARANKGSAAGAERRDHGCPVGEDDGKRGVRGFDGRKRVKGRKRCVSRTHQQKRRCGAVQGWAPSGSAVRCRPQIAASCGRQERPW